jgi:hypothetical protein
MVAGTGVSIVPQMAIEPREGCCFIPLADEGAYRPHRNRAAQTTLPPPVALRFLEAPAARPEGIRGLAPERTPRWMRRLRESTTVGKRR